MDYYSIPAGELGANAKIPLFVGNDPEALFLGAAADMVATIEDGNARGRDTVLVCPVGPVGQYPEFVRLANERGLDMKRTWFVNMDEYLDDSGEWIDHRHPLSFRGFMEREVYGRIRPELLMPESQRLFPDPRRPGSVGETIDRLGGVEVCYGGIGITGHLAFNEPEDVPVEEFARRPTRVLDIAPETRTINAAGELGGAVEAMPFRCVTLGMREILGARRIRLYCFRDWHRAVVRRAAYGEKTARFPVTLLQDHPDAAIFLSANVARSAVPVAFPTGAPKP